MELAAMSATCLIPVSCYWLPLYVAALGQAHDHVFFGDQILDGEFLGLGIHDDGAARIAEALFHGL